MESYYIAEYYEHQTLKELLHDNKTKSGTAKQLANFTFSLHLSEVLHPDYSVGNILCRNTNDILSFALVDLNRIKFGTVSLQKGFLNFHTLDISNEIMDILIVEYANLAKLNTTEAQRIFYNYRKSISRKSKIRKKLKKQILSTRNKLVELFMR
jgi:tRNA A-37 threonylcarbamoyl transferase component Bud32